MVTIRALAAAALLGASALVLSGCSLGAFRVVIPDFESSEVLGMNVYQRVATTGDPSRDWEHLTKVSFTEPLQQDGTEVMEYEVTTLTNGHRDTFTAEVERADVEPDEVTVGLLFYLNRLDAPIRVTSVNAAGESPPSQAMMPL